MRMTVFSLLMGVALVAPAQAQQLVKISGHPDWPPFSWQSGDKMVGIGAELAEIVCKDLGLTAQVAPAGNWKRVQSDAADGTLDMIAGIYVTDERKGYLDYPPTPFTDDLNVVWVVKSRAFPFNSWNDLIGKRGTAMLGDSYGEKFDQFMKDKLTVDRVSTPDLNFKKLVAGRADFYPFSLYGGQIQAKQLGFDDKVESLPNPLSKEGAYLAISKKSPIVKYLPQIDADIKKRVADGTVDKLVKKYVALAAQPRPANQ